MTTQQTDALQCAADLEYSIPRHRIQDAFILNAYKALKMVRTQHARITELESQLAQRFDAADMATASAQGDALDAVRYRFLRDGEWRDTDLEPFIRLQLNTLWDAKIDAARAAQEGGASDALPI